MNLSITITWSCAGKLWATVVTCSNRTVIQKGFEHTLENNNTEWQSKQEKKTGIYCTIQRNLYSKLF